MKNGEMIIRLSILMYLDNGHTILLHNRYRYIKVKVRKRKRRYTKTKRTIEIILRMALFLFIVAGIMVTIFHFKDSDSVKIDLNELTPVELSGYNTQGMISAKMNKIEGYDEFFNTVSVEFSKTQGLSNGDKVEMEYHYDKKVAKSLGLKIKADDEVVAVEDLPIANEISLNTLFQDVEINFSGIAPIVTATIENKSSDPFLKNVQYEIKDAKDYYDIDDNIIVAAVFDEESAIKSGYHVESGENGFTKTFTIKNTDRYITNSDDLTQEQINELRDNALSLFGDANEFGLRIFCDAHLMPVYKNDRTTFKWVNPQFISAYFNVLTNDYMGEVGTHMNDVKLVFDAVITQDDGVSCKTEVVVRYQNIIKHADGSVDLALDSGSIISASGSDANIKKLVRNTEDEKYQSVKIEGA